MAADKLLPMQTGYPAPFQFEPIGFVETCFKEKFGCPRQPGLTPASWGILRLRNELNLSDALVGLEGFSHLWLIWVFHQNTNKGVKTKVHPPRLQGEKIGLFATRTPHRPNPIGLSAVKIEKIKGNEIHLSGVDLVDGTPILDIKPYLASSDSLPDAASGWTTAQAERAVTVEWTPQALEDVEKFRSKTSKAFRQLISEMLVLDPRPTFYKGTVERPNPYTDLYGIRVEDFNVIYRMAETTAIVTEIQPWAEFRPATQGF